MVKKKDPVKYSYERLSGRVLKSVSTCYARKTGYMSYHNLEHRKCSELELNLFLLIRSSPVWT